MSTNIVRVKIQQKYIRIRARNMLMTQPYLLIPSHSFELF